MPARPKSVDAYLAALPADRREALQAVRQTILANLDTDYEEGIQYGMIGYYVPHRVFPAGYHCNPKEPLPFAGLASQKNHMSLYLGCVQFGEGMGGCDAPSAESIWFQEAWVKAGKKLDMGKACIRFKSLEQVPLEVVGEAIRRWPAKRFVSQYQELRAAATGQAPTSSRKAGPKPGAASPKGKATKAGVPRRPL